VRICAGAISNDRPYRDLVEHRNPSGNRLFLLLPDVAFNSEACAQDGDESGSPPGLVRSFLGRRITGRLLGGGPWQMTIAPSSFRGNFRRHLWRQSSSKNAARKKARSSSRLPVIFYYQLRPLQVELRVEMDQAAHDAEQKRRGRKFFRVHLNVFERVRIQIWVCEYARKSSEEVLK